MPSPRQGPDTAQFRTAGLGVHKQNKHNYILQSSSASLESFASSDTLLCLLVTPRRKGNVCSLFSFDDTIVGL